MGGSGVGVLDGVGVSVIVGVTVGVGLGVGVDVIGGRLASASTVAITAVSNRSASLGVGAEQAARMNRPANEMTAVGDPFIQYPIPNSMQKSAEFGGVYQLSRLRMGAIYANSHTQVHEKFRRIQPSIIGELASDGSSIWRVLTVKFGIGILARTVRRLGVPLI